MLSSGFSFEEYDSGAAHQGCHPPQGSEDECFRNQSYLFAAEDPEGINDCWSTFDFYQESLFETGAPLISPNDQPCGSEFISMDKLDLDAVSAVIEAFDTPSVVEADPEKSSDSESSEVLGPKKRTPTISLSKLELLNSSKSFHNCRNRGRIDELMGKEGDPSEGGRELSTEDIMIFAAAHFTHADGDPLKLEHPSCLSLSGLTEEQIKNIHLAILLLDAADKVSNQQYDLASNLLDQCYRFSSTSGNPVQRVVYYFSDALQERISREIGRLSSKRPLEKGLPNEEVEEVVKVLRADHPLQLVTHRTLPFSLLCQFTSIQAIIDNVASAKRIHLIDLSIKHGLQLTVLMQALATRATSPVEYLKISAVGTLEKGIAAVGKRLLSFAETLSLSFDFKAVIVSDMKDLKEDMFEIEEDEALAAYSSLDMSLMIVRPESLDNLMQVIRKLRPCIMTFVEVEAMHNSPSFINRFAEAIFFYSSFFDCLDRFMDRNDTNRLIMEGSFHSHGIQNIIATEGSERVVRHVGISVWRKYFERFGLVEVELTNWSLYQATLLVKQFAHGNSCTLNKNGKSLFIGWKGNPLLFVSAWKFW